MANPFQQQEYRGSGNHDQQQWWSDLNAMRGQKLGDWVTETVTENIAGTWDPFTSMNGEGGPRTAQTRQVTRRYIDTQWGRIYDGELDDYNAQQAAGNTETNQLGGYNPNDFRGAGLRFGRYHNEHGSDAIQIAIGADGTLANVSMNRESNAHMNTWLAIMATAGIGAAGGLAGIGAAEAAQLALAAGSVYAANEAREGGGGSTSAGPGGDPNIEGPTPPPAPPVIEYQDYHEAYAGAARKAHKNPTNLNPDGVTNALFASGNLLLGA